MTFSFWRFTRHVILAFLFSISIVTIGVLYYIEFELPDIDALNTVQLQVPLQIFTSDGKLIAEFGEKRRIPVPYNEIPKPLINAVLATEDQRYFQHPGIDIPGLIRASIKLILTGRKEEGGSTITMQVARSFYLNPNKTFGRKLREILLALKIDHKLSKEKVLELYLNKIFLGNRAYGVAAAAQVYYGKNLNQLTLDEFAMLAGLPKAPSALNPLANATAAKKRRDHVLMRMRDLGYINNKTYKTAIEAPLNASYHELICQIQAPYVAELVRQQLEQMYGDDIYTEGFKVYTTIDSRLQIAANKAVRDNLLEYDQRHGYRGPSQSLGNLDLKNIDEWEEELRDLPSIGGLEPAAVIDMAAQSITTVRANGTITTIPWTGLSWARRQINANYLGRMPRSASEIVKIGDVIYLMQTSEGWRLAQIPKAEGGMVALNPKNGAILAMVGGFDYQNSKFNRITNADRQPGSSFKPFIYSAAFEKGYTLATVINDAPIIVENPNDHTLWRPQNDTGLFYGPTTLREALIRSRNLVSIRLLSLVGAPYAVNYAQRFGFSKSQLPPELSLALGTALVTPLQMATAYATFANSGYKIVPFAIDHIATSQGKNIYQAKPLIAAPEEENNKEAESTNLYAPRVISEQNAFLVTSALHDVIQHGTAVLARSLQRNDIAGKTGTTQNQVDAWFAGYNDKIVAITWMGFDQQQQSLHEYGNKAALPMWIKFMQTALKDIPDHTIEQPAGIVSVKIDPLTGKRALAGDPNAKFEYFMTPYIPPEEEEHTYLAQPEQDQQPTYNNGTSNEAPIEEGALY